MKKNIFILILFGLSIFIILTFNKQDNFMLNTFSDLPTELNGGSCLFSLNTKDFDDDKYVFVNDYANFGFSVINNEKENLTLKEYDTNKGIFNYENKKYNLEIRIIESISSEVESSKIEGILSITDKNNVSMIKDVIGECGT